MVTIVNTKLPNIPEYVFLGLSLVNFGPLINLPNKNPPISVATHIIVINNK